MMHDIDRSSRPQFLCDTKIYHILDSAKQFAFFASMYVHSSSNDEQYQSLDEESGKEMVVLRMLV